MVGVAFLCQLMFDFNPDFGQYADEGPETALHIEFVDVWNPGYSREIVGEDVLKTHCK